MRTEHRQAARAKREFQQSMADAPILTCRGCSHPKFCTFHGCIHSCAANEPRTTVPIQSQASVPETDEGDLQ